MKMTYKEYRIESAENKRVAFITDVHNCHIEWYGVSNDNRMELMCSFLKEQYEKRPYDAIFMLGDYSLDFWQWDVGGSYLHDPPVSNTLDLMERFTCRFPLRPYMIPGNHEQYDEDDWEWITGFQREYSVVYGDTVFFMADTFGGDLDPKVNSDGTYIGINTDHLKQVLKAHPDKKIVLCMHDLIPQSESEEARQLICDNKQIICAVAGHIHRDNTVLLPSDWRSLPVFYCGDFSYTLGREGVKNWGYRVFETDGDSISTEYVRCIE